MHNPVIFQKCTILELTRIVHYWYIPELYITGTFKNCTLLVHSRIGACDAQSCNVSEMYQSDSTSIEVVACIITWFYDNILQKFFKNGLIQKINHVEDSQAKNN